LHIRRLQKVPAGSAGTFILAWKGPQLHKQVTDFKE